jgi:hypothetical protein
MLSKPEIEAIIKSQGMRTHYRNDNSKKGNGISRVYVRAYKYLGPKDKIYLELGRIEQVSAMSQYELTETIKLQFAEKMRLKCQPTNNT